MKKNGLTLVETLIVALVSVAFLGIIFGVVLTGRNSWAKNTAYIDLQAKTRIAMDKMARELSLSAAVLPDNTAGVTIGDCDENPLPGYNCYGDYIEFQVPVVTDDPIAGTVYHENGEIKFGAVNHLDWTIKYLVMKDGPNDHRLFRIAPEEPTILTGACCDFTMGICEVKTETECLAEELNYMGDGEICIHGETCGEEIRIRRPYDPPLLYPSLKDYLSELVAFADDENILASDIKELRIVNPYDPAPPNVIDITIVAEKKSMLGENLEVELTTRVFLRN